jgi:hypothetical protein
LVDDHLISVAIAAPIAETVPAGMTAATLYANIFGHPANAAMVSAIQAAVSAGKTLAQVAAPWIAQAQATIEALYEQVRGVSPTAPVLTSLTASLMAGQTVAQIRSSLASCAATQSELSAVYQNHYGVAPTGAQLAALTQQLVSGTSLEDVETPLLPNSQAETQVTTLFQQIEGVAPGATDLVTDARALLTGTSLSTLRGALAASAVVQNNLSTLYQHVYDATPTAAQLASLTTQLSGGATYAQIQAQFAATAQSEVTSIYQSVLNRSPSVAELSNYTQLLLAGSATILSIYSNLAYSPASVANITSMYQQVIGQAAPQTVLTALERSLSVGLNQIPLTQLQTDLANAATMYQQITGQTATADALTPLIYDYLNNASTTQIRTSLAYSASEVTMLRNTYQQLFGTGITAATLTSLEQALVNGTTTMAGINASLAAQAAADVPTISDVAGSQTVTANSRVLPFGAVVIADTGTNALETVTVTLTGSGTLAGGGGGTLNAAHTAYTAHGTPAIVTAGLESLIFTPPTTGGISQLTLGVQNGVGNQTSDTVAITSVTLKSPTPTMFLYAPTQSATLPSLFSNETIAFPTGGFGVDTITGFSLVQGVIQLPHAIAATFAAVQSHETASAGGTLISFGASESIFLGGIAPSSLHASNFAFA